MTRRRSFDQTAARTRKSS